MKTIMLIIGIGLLLMTVEGKGQKFQGHYDSLTGIKSISATGVRNWIDANFSQAYDYNFMSVPEQSFSYSNHTDASFLKEVHLVSLNSKDGLSPFAGSIYLHKTEAPQNRRGIVGPVTGGLLVGAAGLAVGGSMGFLLEASTCYKDEWFCGLGGLVVGGMIGESVGLPLGVHLGNGRQGNYGNEFLSSLGITGTGILLSVLTNEPKLMLAVPVAQLAVTVSIERRGNE